MNDTEKDRPPRKKDWKREYERGKGPGKYRDDMDPGSFVLAQIVTDKTKRIHRRGQ